MDKCIFDESNGLWYETGDKKEAGEGEGEVIYSQTTPMKLSLTAALPGSAQSVPAMGGFTDVKSSDYFADAVQWAEKNITSGTSATTFSPAVTCTRGQIVTFLLSRHGLMRSLPSPHELRHPNVKPKTKNFNSLSRMNIQLFLIANEFSFPLLVSHLP